MSREYDAIVIGAGPAGCAAARLLASWGHRTLLLHRPEPDNRTLAESIPPSAQRVLATLGVLTSMEDAGFLPWLGNMVWWANADCRIESFLPGQSGYLVDRRAFDRRLRRLAAESGAHVRTGIVRKVEGHEEHEGHEEGREGDHEPGPVNVELEVALNGERQILRSAFVLDCSGRAGVIARRGMRELLPSPRTVALVGAWRARDRFDPARGSERTWLFAIARNVIADALRTSGRTVQAHEGELEDEAAAAVDPLERLRVAEGLARLSDAHREVILAVHLRGHSYQELAAVTGTPVATLRTRAYHALRALRGHLDGTEAPRDAL